MVKSLNFICLQLYDVVAINLILLLCKFLKTWTPEK